MLKPYCGKFLRYVAAGHRGWTNLNPRPLLMRQRTLSLLFVALTLAVDRSPAGAENGPGFSGTVIRRFDISNPYEERISSPSIAIIPVGTQAKTYVVSCDKTEAKGNDITWIFQSKDYGKSWQQVCVLAPQDIASGMASYESGTTNPRVWDGVWTSSGTSVKVQGSGTTWTPVTGEATLNQVPLKFDVSEAGYTFKIPRQGWGSGTDAPTLEFTAGRQDDGEDTGDDGPPPEQPLCTKYTTTALGSTITATYYWQGHTRQREFTRLNITTPPPSDTFVSSHPSPTRLNSPSGAAKFVPPANAQPDPSPGTTPNYGSVSDADVNPPDPTSESMGAHLSTLFYVGAPAPTDYRGLYLIGGGRKSNGNLIIRKSKDQGVTWTDPVVLRNTPGWVLSSSAMAYYGGRRWLAIGGTLVISIDESADPMVAANWDVSQTPTRVQVVDAEEGHQRPCYGGEVAGQASQLNWLAGKPHQNLRETRIAEGWVAITDPQKIFPKYRASNEHLWQWNKQYQPKDGGDPIDVTAYESADQISTVEMIDLPSRERAMQVSMQPLIQAQVTQLYQQDRPGEDIPPVDSQDVVRARTPEGFTEGNAVAGPDGSGAPGVWILPKLSGQPYTARIKIDRGTQGSLSVLLAKWNGPDDLVYLPGAEKKFTAQYVAAADGGPGKFYAVTSPVLPIYASGTLVLNSGTAATTTADVNDPATQAAFHSSSYERPDVTRNTGAIYSSKDLKSWTLERVFIHSNNVELTNPAEYGKPREGFHTFSFAVDGDDMLIVSRTAADIGALAPATIDYNAHTFSFGNRWPRRSLDTNLLTFHRVKNFRTPQRDMFLVSDPPANRVLTYEATEYDPAPIQDFTTPGILGAPQTPTGLFQLDSSDVLIGEGVNGGAIKRYSSSGTYASTFANLDSATQPLSLTANMSGTSSPLDLYVSTVKSGTTGLIKYKIATAAPTPIAIKDSQQHAVGLSPFVNGLSFWNTGFLYGVTSTGISRISSTGGAVVTSTAPNAPLAIASYPEAPGYLLLAQQNGGNAVFSTLQSGTVAPFYTFSTTNPVTGLAVSGSSAIWTSAAARQVFPLQPKAYVFKAAALFGANMVFPRGSSVPIWGTGQPLLPVTVAVGPYTATTTCDLKGNWLARVDTSGTQVSGTTAVTLTLTQSDKTITGTNVVLGEVWLASGQSNMALPLRKSATATNEIAADDDLGQIRLFQVKEEFSHDEAADVEGSWVVASPTTAADFSQVGMIAGREIYKNNGGTPVGVVQSSLGGTGAQAWLDPELLGSGTTTAHYVDDLNGEIARGEWATKNTPSGVFNQMLSGMASPKGAAQPAGTYPSSARAGFAFQGIFWYQGEANTSKPEEYPALFSLLLKQWRGLFGNPNLPVVTVQLPGLDDTMYDTDDSAYPPPHSPAPYTAEPTLRPVWPYLREAQLTNSANPNVRMISSADLVGHLHFGEKIEIGRRVGRAALSGWPRNGSTAPTRITEEGPRVLSSQVITISGAKRIRVTFENVGLGLTTTGTSSLSGPLVPVAPADSSRPVVTGFSISGSDGIYHWAAAVRMNGSMVDVYSPEVTDPTTFRIGWCSMDSSYDPAKGKDLTRQMTFVNLFNTYRNAAGTQTLLGYPAATYRTDTKPR